MNTEEQLSANVECGVQRSAAIAAAIGNLIPGPGLTALDYGCGAGHVGLRLADRFSWMTLADVDQDALGEAERAAAGRPNVEVSTLDLTRGVPGGLRADVVLSAMSWHHIRDVDGLADAIRVVAPGGMLFVADLDADDGSFHADSPDFDGHHGFDREGLAGLLGSHGFDVGGVQDAFRGTRWVGGSQVPFSVFLLWARVPLGG